MSALNLGLLISLFIYFQSETEKFKNFKMSSGNIVRATCKGRLTIEGNQMDITYTKEMSAQDVKIVENLYEIPKVFCERHLNGKLTCNEHDKEFNQVEDKKKTSRLLITFF